MSLANSRKSFAFRCVSFIIAFSFIFSSIAPPAFAQQLPGSVLNLPVPGSVVNSTPAFIPPSIKGLTIHPTDPLQFNFLVDPGEDDLQGESLRVEADRLIKYFLAALTIPENEMWVNLSPYEKDRIAPAALSKTLMGRDLLAQDYMLKQLTSSMMLPENEIGKEFWSRVRAKAKEKFGNTDIPLNTFNKIWIVPEEAVVYEHGNSVFVVESRLKVMLEEDYFALERHDAAEKHAEKDVDVLTGVSLEIVREVVIPEIEKEVNEGKTFAQLRQIYDAMILATWYKDNLQESLLGQVYVDRNKTHGVEVTDKNISQKIYAQYVESIKTGVYNYIREEYNPETQEIIPNKYFSGGVDPSATGDVRSSLGTLDAAQFRSVARAKHNIGLRLDAATAGEETDLADAAPASDEDDAVDASNKPLIVRVEDAIRRDIIPEDSRIREVLSRQERESTEAVFLAMSAELREIMREILDPDDTTIPVLAAVLLAGRVDLIPEIIGIREDPKANEEFIGRVRREELLYQRPGVRTGLMIPIGAGSQTENISERNVFAEPFIQQAFENWLHEYADAAETGEKRLLVKVQGAIGTDIIQLNDSRINAVRSRLGKEPVQDTFVAMTDLMKELLDGILDADDSAVPVIAAFVLSEEAEYLPEIIGIMQSEPLYKPIHFVQALRQGEMKGKEIKVAGSPRPGLMDQDGGQQPEPAAKRYLYEEPVIAQAISLWLSEYADGAETAKEAEFAAQYDAWALDRQTRRLWASFVGAMPKKTNYRRRPAIERERAFIRELTVQFLIELDGMQPDDFIEGFEGNPDMTKRALTNEQGKVDISILAYRLIPIMQNRYAEATLPEETFRIGEGVDYDPQFSDFNKWVDRYLELQQVTEPSQLVPPEAKEQRERIVEEIAKRLETIVSEGHKTPRQQGLFLRAAVMKLIRLAAGMKDNDVFDAQRFRIRVEGGYLSADIGRQKELVDNARIFVYNVEGDDVVTFSIDRKALNDAVIMIMTAAADAASTSIAVRDRLERSARGEEFEDSPAMRKAFAVFMFLDGQEGFDIGDAYVEDFPYAVNIYGPNKEPIGPVFPLTEDKDLKISAKELYAAIAGHFLTDDLKSRADVVELPEYTGDSASAGMVVTEASILKNWQPFEPHTSRMHEVRMGWATQYGAAEKGYEDVWLNSDLIGRYRNEEGELFYKIEPVSVAVAVSGITRPEDMPEGVTRVILGLDTGSFNIDDAAVQIDSFTDAGYKVQVVLGEFSAEIYSENGFEIVQDNIGSGQRMFPVLYTDIAGDQDALTEEVMPVKQATFEQLLHQYGSFMDEFGYARKVTREAFALRELRSVIKQRLAARLSKPEHAEELQEIDTLGFEALKRKYNQINRTLGFHVDTPSEEFAERMLRAKIIEEMSTRAELRGQVEFIFEGLSPEQLDLVTKISYEPSRGVDMGRADPQNANMNHLRLITKHIAKTTGLTEADAVSKVGLLIKDNANDITPAKDLSSNPLFHVVATGIDTEEKVSQAAQDIDINKDPKRYSNISLAVDQYAAESVAEILQSRQLPLAGHLLPGEIRLGSFTASDDNNFLISLATGDINWWHDPNGLRAAFDLNGHITQGLGTVEQLFALMLHRFSDWDLAPENSFNIFRHEGRISRRSPVDAKRPVEFGGMKKRVYPGDTVHSVAKIIEQDEKHMVLELTGLDNDGNVVMEASINLVPRIRPKPRKADPKLQQERLERVLELARELQFYESYPPTTFFKEGQKVKIDPWPKVIKKDEKHTAERKAQVFGEMQRLANAVLHNAEEPFQSLMKAGLLTYVSSQAVGDSYIQVSTKVHALGANINEGDVLTPDVRVVDVVDNGRNQLVTFSVKVTNQRGQMVLEGEIKKMTPESPDAVQQPTNITAIELADLEESGVLDVWGREFDRTKKYWAVQVYFAKVFRALRANGVDLGKVSLRVGPVRHEAIVYGANEEQIVIIDLDEFNAPTQLPQDLYGKVAGYFKIGDTDVTADTKGYADAAASTVADLLGAELDQYIYTRIKDSVLETIVEKAQPDDRIILSVSYRIKISRDDSTEEGLTRQEIIVIADRVAESGRGLKATVSPISGSDKGEYVVLKINPEPGYESVMSQVRQTLGLQHQLEHFNAFVQRAGIAAAVGISRDSNAPVVRVNVNGSGMISMAFSARIEDAIKALLGQSSGAEFYYKLPLPDAKTPEGRAELKTYSLAERVAGKTADATLADFWKGKDEARELLREYLANKGWEDAAAAASTSTEADFLGARLAGDIELFIKREGSSADVEVLRDAEIRSIVVGANYRIRIVDDESATDEGLTREEVQAFIDVQLSIDGHELSAEVSPVQTNAEGKFVVLTITPKDDFATAMIRTRQQVVRAHQIDHFAAFLRNAGIAERFDRNLWQGADQSTIVQARQGTTNAVFIKYDTTVEHAVKALLGQSEGAQFSREFGEISYAGDDAPPVPTAPIMLDEFWKGEEAAKKLLEKYLEAKGWEDAAEAAVLDIIAYRNGSFIKEAFYTSDGRTMQRTIDADTGVILFETISETGNLVGGIRNEVLRQEGNKIILDDISSGHRRGLGDLQGRLDYEVKYLTEAPLARSLTELHARLNGILEMDFDHSEETFLLDLEPTSPIVAFYNAEYPIQRKESAGVYKPTRIKRVKTSHRLQELIDYLARELEENTKAVIAARVKKVRDLVLRYQAAEGNYKAVMTLTREQVAPAHHMDHLEAFLKAAGVAASFSRNLDFALPYDEKTTIVQAVQGPAANSVYILNGTSAEDAVKALLGKAEGKNAKFFLRERADVSPSFGDEFSPSVPAKDIALSDFWKGKEQVRVLLEQYLADKGWEDAASISFLDDIDEGATVLGVPADELATSVAGNIRLKLEDFDFGSQWAGPKRTQLQAVMQSTGATNGQKDGFLRLTPKVFDPQVLDSISRSIRQVYRVTGQEVDTLKLMKLFLRKLNAEGLIADFAGRIDESKLKEVVQEWKRKHFAADRAEVAGLEVLMAKFHPDMLPWYSERANVEIAFKGATFSRLESLRVTGAPVLFPDSELAGTVIVDNLTGETLDVKNFIGAQLAESGQGGALLENPLLVFRREEDGKIKMTVYDRAMPPADAAESSAEAAPVKVYGIPGTPFNFTVEKDRKGTMKVIFTDPESVAKLLLNVEDRPEDEGAEAFAQDVLQVISGLPLYVLSPQKTAGYFRGIYFALRNHYNGDPEERAAQATAAREAEERIKSEKISRIKAAIVDAPAKRMTDVELAKAVGLTTAEVAELMEPVVTKAKTGYGKETITEGRLFKKEVIYYFAAEDSAMPGGIDLDPSLFMIEKKGDGTLIFPRLNQPIENFKFDGFLPVIINVTPITNMPLLLGMADPGPETPENEEFGQRPQLDPGEKRTRLQAPDPEQLSLLN